MMLGFLQIHHFMAKEVVADFSQGQYSLIKHYFCQYLVAEISNVPTYCAYDICSKWR